MQIDPICGMQVDENTAQYKSEYNGKTYYFCAPGCKKALDSEPEKYLKSGPCVDGREKTLVETLVTINILLHKIRGA